MASAVLHSKPNFQLLQMCNFRASNEELNSMSSCQKAKRVTFDLGKRRHAENRPKSKRKCISLPPIFCRNASAGSQGKRKRKKLGCHEKVCHTEKPSPEKELDELSKCETVVIKNKPVVRTNNIGESLFSNAILNCKFNYIKLQLQSGTNVNMSNKLGQTPLMRCCFIENPSHRQHMFKLLLHYGADIQAKDKSGKTVLHYAALLGRSELVGLILNNTLSLDLNELDKSGKTPLMYSVMSGSVDTCRYIVRCLSQYGLSVDRTDSSGVTPFITARTLGYMQIADILQYEGNANVCQGDNKFYRCADEWALMNKKLKKRANHFKTLPPIKPNPKGNEMGQNSKNDSTST